MCGEHSPERHAAGFLPKASPRLRHSLPDCVQAASSTIAEFNDCQVLLCSPIKRARQTANILRDVLPPSTAEEWEDLCELHPGEADGLTWTDYDARFGSFDMMAHQDRLLAPGGESWSEFRERVRNCMIEFAERFDGQTVVAVSHGGFIVASILELFDIPRPGTGAHLHAAPTSITEWRYTNETWSLVRFNDVRHLEETL